jgi:hypothetical protein
MIMTEQWLDATDYLGDIEQINTAHASQSLTSVPASNGRQLVRAVLRDDPGWADWHGVLASMPATALQPAPSPEPPAGPE